MKSLLIALIIISTQTACADSNEQLNHCIRKTYQAATNAPKTTKPSDLLKFVAKDIKACKDSVKSIAKSEKDLKRKAKIADQIKKLQAKLTSK
jgi:hypothetical protein